MALFGINVEEKPWYYALGIGVFVALLLAGAVHWFYFKPLQEEIANKKVELEGLNQEIAKGRAAERKLAQFREEVKRLELELAKLLQILPSKRNTEELIKRIETLTRQGDFTLKKFTPGEFVQKEFYAEWPIEIQVEGTYHNLALFFDRMSRFSRIVNVEDMNVKGVDSIPGKSITSNFTAKTFIYTGDETGQSSVTSGQGAPASTTPVAPRGKAVGNVETLKSRAEGRGIE
ncbi:MAG: type 4a pilus biogenesis protein PilO [Thermoanaerobaculia bacterium]